MLANSRARCCAQALKHGRLRHITCMVNTKQWMGQGVHSMSCYCEHTRADTDDSKATLLNTGLC
jgi:hypothetical protein